MKLTIRVFNLLISVILVVIAALVAYVSVPAFGNQALIVRSGSMQPAIGVGDLFVVQVNKDIASPVNSAIPKYKAGEIVAFKAGAGKTFVTHRIASVKIESGKVFYETMGDANKTVDKVLVAEENIIGAKFISVPKVGKIIAFTKSNIGFPLLVIFPALLVILFEILAIFREVKKQRRILQPEFPSPASLTSLKVLLPIFMTIVVFQSTFAFFSDTETSTGNIFSASTSFPSPSPTPPPIAQTLVMNEVLPLSSENQGQDNCQFLELWNGSGATVGLQNFKLTDGVIATPIAVVNSNTDLPNGQFAILVKSNGLIQQCDALASMPNGTITANFGGQVDLNTGALQLLDADDNVIDTVLWGSSPNPTPAINESIEREPDGTDSETGTGFEPADFVVRTTPQPGL